MGADIRALGTNPIAGENPSGRDVRLEEDFFQIQAEIDRLNSLSLVEEGGIKWPVVEELSSKILEKDSKDLLIAVYLAISLLETSGISSIADSTFMLNGLLTTFWETLYPPKKRMRARFNAMDWWRERTSQWLKKYAGGEVDAEILDQAHDELKVLDLTLAENSLPRAFELIKLLALIPKKAKAVPPPPDPAPTPVAPEPPSPAPAPARTQAPAPAPAAPPQAKPTAIPSPQAPTTPPEDEFQAVSGLLQALDDYLNYVRDSYEDPRYWSVSRLRLWLHIKHLPPNEGNLTRIPAPDKEILLNIKRLLDDGANQEAIAMVENNVDAYLFWMDLHYLAYQGLMALGYVSSARCLKWSCQAFVECIPGIVPLAFDDGTPFFSEESKAFIEEKGATVTTTDKGKVDYRSLGDLDPQQALMRLGQSEFTPKNGRDRVERALAEALIWQRLERPRTAAGAAAELEGLIAKHDLAEFDPDLAARAAKAMYKVYRNLGPGFQNKARESLNLLAKLKPSEVLGMPAPEDE
ncbi:MAG: TssA family type VI secretion system protein [Deltaproteobacteria bacterium]|jgi:type VI secretion system protein VasJ|nr:TssA family type VI secretion system protein [Deltaproteobacteria bacterium]